ncbi:MAG TPA: phosphotransferase [Acidimicrobiales bacterium]|nr:phosphotransferase [Acidimicrobiales bacterium]
MNRELVLGPLPPGVDAMIPAYLGRQRWYAGSAEPGDDDVSVVTAGELVTTVAQRRLLWARVEGEGARYQVLIGERPGGEPADFLGGHDAEVLGAVGSKYYYDATLDPELALALLAVVSDGSESAERVRPVSAEQSNTSLVYDDRIILKLFRRLLEGANPDVEVTTALSEAGFTRVAAPVAHWRYQGQDLAFAQRFLAGGSEGWALALTSLRDFYAASSSDPAEVGGDFSAEAARLGRMTAEMHLAMAAAFGVERRALAELWWPALLNSVEERLVRVGAEVGGGLPGAIAPFVGGLRAVGDPGPAIRVHGDYHLGQVMRTDSGWYVLDFEGEPARALEERVRPSSPLKDVAGMLRSLQYASRFVLGERADAEVAALVPRADAWEWHNRDAFLGGYRQAGGIDALLPGDTPTWSAVLAAYEVDKALYELDYERAYRPDWASIPLGAVTRLLASTGQR